MISKERFFALLESGKRLRKSDCLECFRYYRANPTQENRNLLAMRFKGFVERTAHRLKTDTVSYDDLFQEGFLILLDCVEGFNPDVEGADFHSYYCWKIVGAMSLFVDNDTQIHLPKSFTRYKKALSNLVEKYQEKTGVEPTESVAKELYSDFTYDNLDYYRGYREFSLLYSLSHPILSLNTKWKIVNEFEIEDVANIEEMEEVEYGDLIYDSYAFNQDDYVEWRASTDIVDIARRILNDREFDMICLYYGLSGKNPTTYNNIAKMYGFSCENVRRIMHKAFRKLRHNKKAFAIVEDDDYENVKNLRLYGSYY